MCNHGSHVHACKLAITLFAFSFLTGTHWLLTICNPCGAGVDEAGRGPLAGPVVAGACIMPAHVNIAGIRDSKLMTAEQREQVFELLMAHPEVICAA